LRPLLRRARAWSGSLGELRLQDGNHISTRPRMVRMRHLTALVVAVLVAVMVACGAGVKLPPVAPEEVEVFLPGSYPDEDYKVLARFDTQVPLNVSDSELIERARAQAAEYGADALVISGIRRTTEGQIELNLQQEQVKILDAMAVYYPSRHPELQKE
jgi:hypothetical protein